MSGLDVVNFYTVTSHLIFVCAISSSILRMTALKTGVVASLLLQTLGYVDVLVKCTCMSKFTAYDCTPGVRIHVHVL